MKRMFLDTTFVLPLFGLEINASKNPGFKEDFSSLWNHGIDGYKLYLSTVSLIEAAYILNGVFRQSGDIEVFRKYEIALPTINNSPHVELFDSPQDIKSMQYLTQIRALGHKDLMDCWILGSAAALGCIFLSEEKVLKRLVSKDEQLGKVEFWNWKEFKKRAYFK